jgi:glucose-6-phosphate isomerase
MKKMTTLNGQREKYAGEAAGLWIDYSRNYFTPEILQHLHLLAATHNVPKALQELNEGKVVNLSENRPALHSALRKPRSSALPEVRETRERMEKWVNQIHQSHFTDIVNIGIGGSDLGPQMAVQALMPYAVTAQRIHFVSTLDAHQVTACLAALSPETTLVIVSSKSFTTQETLVNATVVKAWLSDKFAEHAFAVTLNQAEAMRFGIREDHIFPLWAWVGGRYSLWSAIGLPLALSIGMDNFEAFLEGGHAMDNYVLNTPLEENLAVTLALLNHHYLNTQGAQTHAILPYDFRLRRFPAYLQQLEMESNGKSLTQTGEKVGVQTGPIIWGEMGTDGQHSFFQLLHQGTQCIPADFILIEKPDHPLYDQHLMLLSHGLSQMQALSVNNRPSTLILLPTLSPYYLGALIALYEYKVFISAVLWNINPFDQPGVELGKKLAKEVYDVLKKESLSQVSPCLAFCRK